MTTKHTPGPWQVAHNDPTQVCDADGEVRGCSEIAHCMVGTMGERRANAALIAAAPDLLAALRDAKRMIDTLTSGDYVNGDDPVARRAGRVVDAADAAIAKAEGRS